MGHPWGAINGPEFRNNRFAFSVHNCGTEREFICTWGKKKKDKSLSVENKTGDVRKSITKITLLKSRCIKQAKALIFDTMQHFLSIHQEEEESDSIINEDEYTPSKGNKPVKQNSLFDDVDKEDDEEIKEVCCDGRRGNTYCLVTFKEVENEVYDSKWCDLV